MRYLRVDSCGKLPWKEEIVKRFIPFIGLSVALLVSVVGLAAPDLIIADISLSPNNPTVGQMVTITATVENIGSSNATDRFNVRFLMDGVQIDAPSVPFGINAGRSKEVSVTWPAEAGVHTITIDADQPLNRIRESNEGNNSHTLTFPVTIDADTSNLSNIKVAVARFEDRSGSGFVNVGEGVADELIERLVNSGVHVLERGELEAVMQERGLNPAITADLATAGQLLGADLLIVGSVTKVNVQQSALSLGFLSVSSASVNVAMSARLVNVYTSEIMSAFSSEGSAEGSTGFSVDIGKVLSLTQPVTVNVCTGGLRTDKSSYYIGETIHFGYKNSGGSGWYGVEIDSSGGTPLKWLDYRFINAGSCGEWLWDQRDTSGVQLGPGFYTAKLWDGTSYIATVGFQIRPGAGHLSPLMDEITVGTGQFDETIVGKATNGALDQLVSHLITGMDNAAPAVLASRSAAESMLPATRKREGQIAAILPDGRIAVNIGAGAGVHKGDFFQVLATANLVIDPATGEILAYDTLGIKGEIVVTEVHDRVCYAVRTTDFDPLIGDIVRPESK